MAHYEDLNLCDYFGGADSRIRAVGWLAPDHTYVKGPVAPEFFAALMQLLSNPWQPFVLVGRHRCEFCKFTGGPARITMNHASAAIGTTNLFVPGGEVAYVAPSLIVHYIDAHGYAPPVAFRGAVLACPPMRSIEYLKAIRHYGLHDLAARARERAGDSR